MVKWSSRRGRSLNASIFGCAASEGDSVRGSPCGEPARLRFTSLRPPPAAAPPNPPVILGLRAPAPLFSVALLTVVVLFTQGGCAVNAGVGKDAGSVRSSKAPAQLSSVITGVPFLPQEDDTCGPSSLAMVLRFLGQDVDAREIVRETRTGGLKGTLITDLTEAARRRGFAAEIADLDLPRLRERIVAGVPVILLVDLGIWTWSRPHYLVAYGWTPEGVVAHSGREQGKVIPFSTLDAQWAKMGRLAIIVSRQGAR